MVALLIAAAAVAQAPGRDPGLLHKDAAQVAAEKDAARESALRQMLQLGGSPAELAESTSRLAALLRARGLALAIRGQAEADAGDDAAAARDRSAAAQARGEAITRYRDLLAKYPDAPRTDEALFFLADTLQDSGKDDEAVAAARELTRRFPRSAYAPASHVFIGEHLFDKAKLDAALAEYRAAATVPTDDVYPYALYKAAWCRFNQSAFDDAMKLLHRVATVSGASKDDANKVALAKEARRDYVIVYARVGKPEEARDVFAQKFGAEAGRKMLEQYAKVLFDQARDPEAQLVTRQLIAMHGDQPAAALDQTRLLVIAQRTGKRRDLLDQARVLVDTFGRVRQQGAKGEELDEANRLAEETLRTLAVQIHNEARKTDLDETWAAAGALYDDYLALFQDAEASYELRYFHGELLYTRKQKARAAEEYEAVTKQDLAALQAKKQPGRWLQKAAWSAVLSRDEVIRGAGAEVKDTGERRAQRPLTADEQKLAAACRLYLDALPEGPHAVEVAFKVGRLEYVSSDLAGAEKHLAWIATKHPENELAEYAANLVLDISNLRKDWPRLRAWARQFLADPKLCAHGNLRQDLVRIEEESAYAVADANQDDARKAAALQQFYEEHPHGELSDKALFGAAAALSRAGRVDDALAARDRLLKDDAQSPLVPRALLASASDRAQVGDLAEAAALLERYAAGYKREADQAKWRREHPSPGAKKQERRFEEEKARTALHDAAVLREARAELKKAVEDRALELTLWPKEKDGREKADQQLALALLRGKAGEVTKAAHELAALGKTAQKPALQLRAWREAARLFTRVHETGNAQWSWTEAERVFKSLGAKGRAALTDEAQLAAAEAHYALGQRAFDDFRNYQIRMPLMQTLNRKIALLQAVKKRAEETVAMRQAEPAVCALAQLGEAQMLLGQAIAQSPFPPGLNAEQKKLYRDAVGERAQPLYAQAKETLHGADDKARELGVTGSCTQRAQGLLDKLGEKRPAHATLLVAAAPLREAPEYVDADGHIVWDAKNPAAGTKPVQSVKSSRLLDDALLAEADEDKLGAAAVLERFRLAAAGEPTPGPAHLDEAIALDLSGQPAEAEKVYLQVAAGRGALAYAAAERAAALAVVAGDAAAARGAVKLARAGIEGSRPEVLRADVELALGDAETSAAVARGVLMREPNDVAALSALARAQLALGQPGTARVLAARAAKAAPGDADPLLVKVDAARAEGDAAGELAAARAAAQADAESSRAALVLGRALFERGLAGEAIDELSRAVELDDTSYAAVFALAQALRADGRAPEAVAALKRAVQLAPAAAEPHFELAQLRLDGDNDAHAALEEAKLFLSLSKVAPPASHPVHALVQRCEEALHKRAQASVVQ